MEDLLALSDEQTLRDRYHNQINDFWRTGNFAYFLGVEECQIHYCTFVNPEYTRNIVIVPGRAEGYLKYKELAYDLHSLACNVYIIDHRGQGLSQRLQTNNHKGYVDDFDHYVDDLHTFISSIVSRTTEGKPDFLAHSMGGAIATRYMQKYPNEIKAAALCSPMMGINTGGIPHILADAIISTLHTLNQLFSKQSWYFLGQKNYVAKPFENNRLMHSEIRYLIFNQLYDEVPTLRLGGVTVKWLIEARKANQLIFEELEKLTTPILVIQAQADVIVDNEKQQQFCEKLHKIHPQSCPNGEAKVIEGARHELLFEQDCYRKEALTEAILWLAAH